MPAVEKRKLRTRIHITPDQAEFIKANAHMSLGELGAKYSVSINKVRRWKIELGFNGKRVIRGKNKPKEVSKPTFFSWDYAREMDFTTNY